MVFLLGSDNRCGVAIASPVVNCSQVILIDPKWWDRKLFIIIEFEHRNLCCCAIISFDQKKARPEMCFESTLNC